MIGSEEMPMEINHVDAFTTQPGSNESWRKGRQLLRQYLQEIGYTDMILDVRSFRVRSLLGLGTEEQQNGRTQSGSEIPRSLAEKALKDSERSVLQTADFLDTKPTVGAPAPGTSGDGNAPLADHEQDDSDSEEDVTVLVRGKKKMRTDHQGNLGLEEEAALEEFDFLSGDVGETALQSSASRKQERDQWGVDYKELDKMKEQYIQEARTKKMKQHSTENMAECDSRGSSDYDFMKLEHGLMGRILKGEGAEPQMLAGQNLSEFDSARRMIGEVEDGKLAGLLNLEMGSGDLDEALGLTTGAGGTDDIDPMAEDLLRWAEAYFDSKAWENSRNQQIYDSCGGKLLGSDDALRKTWTSKYTLRSHYDSIRAMGFHPVESVLLTASEDGSMKLWNLQKSTGASKKGQNIQDLEPAYTFRAHRNAVLCLCMSPTGESCYTGGFDGTVKCWNLPSPNIDMYDPFDPSVLAETLVGHTDAVWSVAFHTSDNRLISASADGSLRLWEPGTQQGLLRTFAPPCAQMRPTSVDFVSTDPQQALVAYSDQTCASILDLESGKPVLNFDFPTEGGDNTVGKINQIASHPTMPVTVTAHSDHMIRYFDNNSGRCIEQTVAHQDSVTCLSIDPNGLYLLSGCHDGSLRLWNLDTKTCLQEITAHRKKFDEGVMAVAFHPSRPMIASAGADAIAKVFV